MKAIILCGGKGTRISEETKVIPKPMVKIGNKPILWHIMKSFSRYGIEEFVLAAGYKAEIIKKNFNIFKEFKKVEIVNTGNETMTGGRILRLKNKLKNEKTFLLTYGDGLSNINFKKLIKFHNEHKKIATITAVHPPVRFGELDIKKNNIVSRFEEKPQAKAGWINGGFFVLNEEIFNFIKNDQTVFEREPLTRICGKNELVAFKHKKFWYCMDTLRDKIVLNKMYNKKIRPWLK